MWTLPDGAVLLGHGAATPSTPMSPAKPLAMRVVQGGKPETAVQVGRGARVVASSGLLGSFDDRQHGTGLQSPPKTPAPRQSKQQRRRSNKIARKDAKTAPADPTGLPANAGHVASVHAVLDLDVAAAVASSFPDDKGTQVSVGDEVGVDWIAGDYGSHQRRTRHGIVRSVLEDDGKFCVEYRDGATHWHPLFPVVAAVSASPMDKDNAAPTAHTTDDLDDAELRQPDTEHSDTEPPKADNPKADNPDEGESSINKTAAVGDVDSLLPQSASAANRAYEKGPAEVLAENCPFYHGGISMKAAAEVLRREMPAKASRNANSGSQPFLLLKKAATKRFNLIIVVFHANPKKGSPFKLTEHPVIYKPTFSGGWCLSHHQRPPKKVANKVRWISARTKPTLATLTDWLRAPLSGGKRWKGLGDPANRTPSNQPNVGNMSQEIPTATAVQASVQPGDENINMIQEIPTAAAAAFQAGDVATKLSSCDSGTSADAAGTSKKRAAASGSRTARPGARSKLR